MGGNALKNSVTRRYNKDEYLVLSQEIITTLNKSEDIYKTKIPYSYRNKETFGDLDILLSFKHNLDLRNFIKSNFETKEVVSNGDCLSFEYKEFQVDLIKENEYFDTHLEYLNWNDLGNIIGRVAHKFGLKYGHKGLLFVIKNDDGYNSRELTITQDIHKILDFLGFDFDRYTFGFDTVQEIYDFVISSKFFNPEIFSFEAMNHINRVRNKKRITYQGFIDYIESIKLDTNRKFFQYNKNKEVYLPRLNYYFPEAEIFQFIDNYNKDIALKEAVKEKFNGKVVNDITGLSDKSLGEFIAYFKNMFWSGLDKAPDISFDNWILLKSQDEINSSLKIAFQKYSSN